MSLPRTIRAGTRPTGLIPRALGPRYEQMMGKRHKSGPYGYTQAKALVYSKYGNPADVLSYILHFLNTHPKYIIYLWVMHQISS